MPPSSQRPLSPDAFNRLSESKKLNYAFKAQINNAFFETTILPWLKDPSRTRSKQDELVILVLHEMASRFIEEGIALPPPFMYQPMPFFQYSEDFINYMEMYSKYPSRPATETEKKELLYDVFNSSSAANNDIMAMINSDLMPSMEDISDPLNPFNQLEILSEQVTQQLIELAVQRGDIETIGFENLLALFENKLNYWKERKQVYMARDPTQPNVPVYKHNKGIHNYTFAISLMKKIELEKRKKNAREIYTAFENADPNSILYTVPMNVVGVIGQYATGLKPREYLEGGRRKKTRRLLRRRKASRKSLRKH